ncbi:MAG TPA: hypothetical protein HA264_07700 [Methanolinea sp.]|jgi:hypothetical protein|nr:MAG: hypothetical protein A4E36_01667 [Methanoregulaceae archaeon PtaB.Bin009]OPY42848.1 MAG: hypothetical protein A4E41_00099 [Methanoregulaceae archaeon PtaU1.Bin066]HII76900.1 hypothetical protein [Methanolinea sp.]HNQ30023.1 hypothetical protein [Methanolinea sp.]
MNLSKPGIIGSIFFLISFLTFSAVPVYAEMISSRSSTPRLSEISKMSAIEKMAANPFSNEIYIPDFGYHDQYISPWGADASKNYESNVKEFGEVIASFLMHKGNSYSEYRSIMR